MSIFTNLCKSQQDRWRHLETRQLLGCPAYHHSQSINPSESDCTWCPPTFQRCRPEFSSVCNLSSTYLFTVGASVVHPGRIANHGTPSVVHAATAGNKRSKPKRMDLPPKQSRRMSQVYIEWSKGIQKSSKFCSWQILVVFYQLILDFVGGLGILHFKHALRNSVKNTSESLKIWLLCWGINGRPTLPRQLCENRDWSLSETFTRFLQSRVSGW